MGGYLPDGCTQEDLDRAAGGYEGFYCGFCDKRVDDEHECPGRELEMLDESDQCPHGVLFCEPCEDCEGE